MNYWLLFTACSSMNSMSVDKHSLNQLVIQLIKFLSLQCPRSIVCVDGLSLNQLIHQLI